MTEGRRVIMITGSRKASLGLMAAVAEALDELKPDYLILGDCPTGADDFALKWALSRGVPYSLHRADWNALGRKAGPVRNLAMVREAAARNAFVLAFPRGHSPGTSNCVNQARAAGLEVTEL